MENQLSPKPNYQLMARIASIHDKDNERLVIYNGQQCLLRKVTAAMVNRFTERIVNEECDPFGFFPKIHIIFREGDAIAMITEPLRHVDQHEFPADSWRTLFCQFDNFCKYNRLGKITLTVDNFRMTRDGKIVIVDMEEEAGQRMIRTDLTPQVRAVMSAYCNEEESEFFFRETMQHLTKGGNLSQEQCKSLGIIDIVNGCKIPRPYSSDVLSRVYAASRTLELMSYGLAGQASDYVFTCKLDQCPDHADKFKDCFQRAQEEAQIDIFSIVRIAFLAHKNNNNNNDKKKFKVDTKAE